MTEKNDWIECPNCGTKEPKGGKFCGICGTSLEFSTNHTISEQTRQVIYQEKQATYPTAPRDDFDPNNLPPSSTDKGGNASVAFYLALFGFFLLLWPLGIGAIYYSYKGIKNEEEGWQLRIALILGTLEILLMIALPIILIIIIIL
ncbi:MAG: hypothetical protein GF308_14240 [Candidatus Heimdallarchaeota archaeon]|nr:hypothetical protein [Candidatus Heimdallarchaeota archaeon]